MTMRKMLGLALIVVYTAPFLLLAIGSRESAMPWLMAGIFLVLPVFSCRYAVGQLQRQSYISWFFLGMLPHVPFLLLLEKPVAPKVFRTDMKIAGQEPSSHGLGELTAFYTVAAHSHLAWKIASVFLAFLLSPILVLPFLSPGKPASPAATLMPFVLILVLALLFVWLVNRQEKKTGRRWVALFSEGLVCAWPDEQIRQVRWSDVQEVWQEFRDQYVNGIRTVHHRRCRLQAAQLKSGLEFTERLQGVEELTARIHERVSPFQIQRMGDALAAGQTVTFGKKLSVSEQGIALKRDLLPWSELAGVYLNSGFVVIARHARSGAEARVRKTTQGLSAFATRIVGTAQPYAPGGDAVIWKKTPVDQTANPVALTILVGGILKELSPQALAE